MLYIINSNNFDLNVLSNLNQSDISITIRKINDDVKKKFISCFQYQRKEVKSLNEITLETCDSILMKDTQDNNWLISL